MSLSMSRPSVFVSYSHHDAEALVKLMPYLQTLQHEGLVDVWTDRELKGGDRWRDEISASPFS
jgi:oligoribonuclease (3'-5' exoribonuclease)